MTSETPCGLNYCDLGDGRDLKDARAVLNIFKAVATVQGAGATHSVITRRALTGIWQWPRIPQGNGQVGGNKPETVRWTPDAHAIYEALTSNMRGRKVNPPGQTLVAEHLVPLALVSQDIAQNLVANASDMRTLLRSSFEKSPVVVLTKKEDTTINKKGWRSTTPDPSDPWRRYRDSIGIDEEHCIIPNPQCICARRLP